MTFFTTMIPSYRYSFLASYICFCFFCLLLYMFKIYFIKFLKCFCVLFARSCFQTILLPKNVKQTNIHPLSSLCKNDIFCSDMTSIFQNNYIKINNSVKFMKLEIGTFKTQSHFLMNGKKTTNNLTMSIV